MRRPFLLSLLGSIFLAGSAFLPWLRIGSVGLAGVPDPAGFFILGLGLLGLLLSAVGVLTTRDTRQALVLIGLGGLTALLVVWQTGPSTVADRALAHAQAVALVDNVPVEPVPPITVGSGLLLGLLGAATVAGVGLAGVVSRPR